MRRHLWIALLLALVVAGCGSRELDGRGRVSFATIDADPDWSPNGALIAFVSSRRGSGIFVVRPDGTGLRRVFRGVAHDVDWSPDGRRIAFAKDDGIYVMRSAGGRPLHILRGGRFSLPEWAPNGRVLALVKEEPDLTTAVYVVRPDGSGLRRLLPSPVPRFDPRWSIVAASETEPAWAPDGRSLVVEQGDGDVVVIEVAGARRRLVAQVRGHAPAWSPDGRTIAFQSGEELWAAKADGRGGLRRLAPVGADPSWAPDSRHIVFEVRHHRGRYLKRSESLSIVDVTSGRVRTLTYG